MSAVATYLDYRDVGGLKFPMSIRQSQGGHPTLDVAVKEGQGGVPVDIEVLEPVAKSVERVLADKVADGVWFIFGGSHNRAAIELHRIKNGNHNDTFLVVYLPKKKLLIEADVFMPPPPNTALPETPKANTVTLVENISRLKLSVNKILPLHGRVVPLSDLLSAVGN